MEDDKPTPEPQEKKKPAAKARPAAKAAPAKEAPPAPVPPRCLERLQEARADAVEDVKFCCGVAVVRVAREHIADVCRFLRDDPECKMSHLSNLCGVDMIRLDRPEPRFDVVYNLFSLDTGERITLKAAVADNEEIDTVSTVWRTANWHERETFDMFGIRFAGHPDLRRILMPDEFDAYPLRKDFPLEGREKDHGYWRRPEDDSAREGR